MARTFQQLYDILRANRKDFPQTPSRLLAIDPGETTGWALFVGSPEGTVNLERFGQLGTGLMEHAPKLIETLIDDCVPSQVVCEDYRVYAFRADQHSWSALHTPQLIGAIKTLCSQRQIPVKTQMAQTAKNFCNDPKLKEWGFYQRAVGQRHARDAIRHGAYYILFRKSA